MADVSTTVDRTMPVGITAPTLARRRTSYAALAFVAVVALLSARAWTKLDVPGAPNAVDYTLSDFRDAVYYPERAFLDGKNPYDYATLKTYPIGNGFPVYSPITFIVHLPFGVLPYRTAQLAYFVTTIALTLALAWLALVMSGADVDAARVLAIAAVLLVSRPGHQNLLLGQTTLQIAIGAYVAMHWARTRPWLAASGLMLASIKPNWILPLGILMLFRRDVMPVLIGALLATVGAALALVVLAATPGALPAVLTAARRNFEGWNVSTIVLPASSWIRVDAWALFGRFVGGDLSLAGKMVTSAVIVVASAIVLMRLRGTTSAQRHVSLAVTCLALLLCIHHQAYDLLFLAAPLVGLALVPAALPVDASAMRLPLFVLLAIPFANYLATESALTAFAVSGTAWIAITSINGAAMLAAWAVYVGLAFTRRFE